MHHSNRGAERRSGVLLTRLATAGALCVLTALSGCAKEPDVTLYCALDQTFSEPLIAEFERETGLTVRAEFDVEAHKTVGLVRRIREERNRPRCDVFWNNEIAHTIDLANDGLLASYDSPSAKDIPEAYRDAERRWTGFAARARVFIVNTDLVEPSAVQGLADLVDETWAGKAAMARPLTGTTLTHFTALSLAWGDEAVLDYLRQARDGGLVMTGGNGQVMRLVAGGEAAWGLTDTDDFNVARENGAPVVAVYPDQEAAGTLLIPNTVAMTANAPHPEAAQRLIDYILSEEVEARLAASRSAQVPVRDSVARPEHVTSAADFRVMPVDWQAVAEALPGRFAAFEELYVQ